MSTLSQFFASLASSGMRRRIAEEAASDMLAGFVEQLTEGLVRLAGRPATYRGIDRDGSLYVMVGTHLYRLKVTVRADREDETERSMQR